MLTLEGALWNAQYLNLMCRYANVVEMACRSNMTNSYCSGIIGTTPAGLIKRPSYYVMKLYADHTKTIPVQVGKLPQGLDLMACTDEKREKLCVFAVNLRREPVTVTEQILRAICERFARAIMVALALIVFFPAPI